MLIWIKRIDRTNLESVLVIYKKALDDRVFRTPVGLEYLRELQGELKAEQDLLGEEIPPIPLWTNFADTREKTSPARRRSNRHRKKIKIRRSGCLLL